MFGHTANALLSTPSFGPDSDHVVAAMKSVHVSAEGSDCTWWGFYLGFGYFVSIFFVLSAVVTWVLGGLERRDQRRWSTFAWALFASYLASALVALRYLFIVPVVFSSVVAALLGLQCVLLRVKPAAESVANPF